jgi:hypothetical protein
MMTVRDVQLARDVAERVVYAVGNSEGGAAAPARSLT